MRIVALIFGAALAIGLTPAPAGADGSQCLSPQERRHVSASGKVVPLSKAIRVARARRNEVLHAQLCQGPKGLVYVLTLLTQNGKVTRATIDAASGTLTSGG